MGDIVYFQATANKSSTDLFLCKAIIDRTPTKENPLCKATVIAINPNPLNKSPNQPTHLLGKRIARKPSQLLDPSNIFLSTIYKEDQWISLPKEQLEVINNKISRRR